MLLPKRNMLVSMEAERSKNIALRAKELAEKNLLQKDLARAKSFAMRARELYPYLDGLPQLLATIEVYMIEEDKVNGETDWYRILGVHPLADDETIRRQYGKLVLTMHPDRNKSVAADGAFSLISQAWSLLSDKTKRISYDQKYSLMAYQGHSGGKSSRPASQQGSHDIFNTANEKDKDLRRATHPIPSQVSPVTVKRTFWTMCTACKTKFEYHMVYINRNLVCTICHKPFCASETSPPPLYRNASSTLRAPQMKQRNLKSTVMEINDPVLGSTPMSAVNSLVGLGPSSMPGDISSVPTSTTVAEAPGAVMMSSGNLNRKFDYLTQMSAANSSVGSGLFSRSDGISSVPTSSVTVAEAPDAVRMSSDYLKRRMLDGLTQMHAVNSSVRSGPFSQPGGISSVPTSGVTVAEAPGAFRRSSENLKRRMLDDSTLMSAVNTSVGSAPFSMAGGISSVSTSSVTVAEAPGAVRMSSDYLKRRMLDGLTQMSAVNSSVGSGPSSLLGGISSVQPSSSPAAEASGVFRMSSENLKRRLEDLTPVMRDEAQLGITRAVDGTGAGLTFRSSCFGSNIIPKGEGERKKRRTDEHKVDSHLRKVETKTSQNDATRELSHLELRDMLMSRTRRAIDGHFSELKASSALKNSGNVKNTDIEIKEKKEKNKERAINSVKSGAKEYVDSSTASKKCYAAAPEPEVPDSLSMNVPDPHFHDFDGDRIENAFGENQVWAAYDNDDGMPRYYCLINNVISKNPFQMRISWLNAKGNDELGPINWVSSGFPKTSGNFRIGKYRLYSALNSFSHMVKWTKGSRGVIHIYPKKGDVWALYQNWSPEWNEFTADDIIQKYVMVEVLDDYSEEQGVNVAPLTKVAGFRTVFRKNADPEKTRNILKGEMFRFSHQVPSFFLTGEEGKDAPRGCLELDPAAMPLELLQVVPEDVELTLPMVKRNEHESNPKDSDEPMREKVCKPPVRFVYERRRFRQKKEPSTGNDC